MMPVFLDTVGLLAVWGASDQWNAAADAAYQVAGRNRDMQGSSPTKEKPALPAAAYRKHRRDGVHRQVKVTKVVLQRKKAVLLIKGGRASVHGTKINGKST